jgi:hypothetical protein
MSSPYRLGSITTGYRPIQDGKKYDKYFPKPGTQDRIVIQDGEVTDTVELMKRVVWKYINDTKGIAPVLKGGSTKATCQNIWEFLYHNIQYKLDKRGLEQLRRPARSWAERQTGVDCDCFAIFCSSILTNLKIPHSFRITKYGGDHFQHVYVVVPDGEQTIIIDPVLSEFNYEKPFTQNQDFSMNLQGIDVAVLSGTDDPLEETLLGFEMGDASGQVQMDAMFKYLVSSRNTLAQYPNMIAHVEDPEGFIKMLDYAIQHWNTDKRDAALEVLAANEQQLNQLHGLYGQEGLGAAKNFFQGVKTFSQNAGTGVKTAAKTVAKAVIQYNPISLAARGGFLLAMRLNLRNMASKLKWAYGSKEQAAKNGISATQWEQAKSALTKVEGLFADKLQGDRNTLKNAILQGKAGGLSGTQQFGEPITLAASIAAATPVIVATLKFLKDAGLLSTGEDANTGNLAKEAEALNNGMTNALPNANSSAALTSRTYPDASASVATSAGDSNSSSGGGVMSFIKEHPIITALGLGGVTYGIYKLLKPKSKAKALAGAPAKPRVSSAKRAPAKKTTLGSTPRKTSKTKIKKLKLL